MSLSSPIQFSVYIGETNAYIFGMRMLHIFRLPQVPDSQPCQRNLLLSVGMDIGKPFVKVISNLSRSVYIGMPPLLPSSIAKTTSDVGLEVGVWERKTSITELTGSRLGAPISLLFPTDTNMNWHPTQSPPPHILTLV